MAPHVGEEFAAWKPPAGGDSALGVVGFSIYPHLDSPMCPGNTTDTAQKWASRVSVPAYAIDDQTAIKVVNGAVNVVSDGHWRLFNHWMTIQLLVASIRLTTPPAAAAARAAPVPSG